MEITESDAQVLLESYRESIERHKRQLADAEDTNDSMQLDIESLQKQLDEAKDLICQLCATTELDDDGKPCVWTTAYENEGIPNVVSERNALRDELNGVRERMNELALHCDKLEKENRRLSDNGRIDSYLQTLQAITQLAADVGIPDAESTGHDTLVIQLREKFRANQLPAGAVCFVPTGEVRQPKKGEWFMGKMNGVHYADRDFYSSDYSIYHRVEAMARDEAIDENARLKERLQDLYMELSQPLVLLLGQEMPGTIEAAAERLLAWVDALRQEVERLKGESKANQEAADVLRLKVERTENLLGEARMMLIYRACSGAKDCEACALIDRIETEFGITLPAKDEQPEPVVVKGTAESYLDFLNGTSPVHRQLAEARAEIENLVIALNESNDTIERYTKRLVECDRDREAWDAVRKWQMDVIGDWAGESWKAKSFRFAIAKGATDYHADPREAVLELAKSLEKS